MATISRSGSNLSRFAYYSPNLVRTSKGNIQRKAASDIGQISGTAGKGSVQAAAQSPLYYDYRWSSPDKFYFPRNRVVANSIWREIYKRDPAIAVSTDMYSELPWSSFELMGIDDKSIRQLYEDMFTKLNIVPKLPSFTRDYYVTGELILHNIFNSTQGIWERVIPHNPDYVRVEGIGLVTEQPLLWLLPTPEIKRLVNSTDPRVKKLQKLIPREIINSFRANKEVPLDPLNTTFIPRLNCSTDLRGTSIYTRLFRVVMYEDFIVNASLAVAQRNAAPLRIFKLGDPNSGWLPDEDDEAAFIEMLSMAEADPMAAIVMHHNVSAELVGVSDKVLLISREWDFIERVKLLAMGISKSFISGETSFASAVAGLQSLLERLSVLRLRFENDWIIKKIMEPVAEIHEFYKRKPSEIEHRIRVKRPLEERELIVPKIKWKKSLDPAQDVAILNIWRDLRERGILSERTYASGAGVDIDTERKNLKEERIFKQSNPDIYGVPAQPPQVPGMPGQKPGAPKAPTGTPLAPMPASYHKRASNPYRGNQSPALNELHDRLEDASQKVRGYKDSKLVIPLEDAMEICEDVMMNHPLDEKQGALLDSAQLAFDIPLAGSNLLSSGENDPVIKFEGE
jgi:hypothetical protein